MFCCKIQTACFIRWWDNWWGRGHCPHWNSKIGEPTAGSSNYSSMVHSLWSGTRSQATNSLCLYTPPETKFHDWVLTCFRLKAGLLGIWGSGGCGVRKCVCSHVPERDLDWTSYTFGLWLHVLMEHRNSHFAHASCFTLIGTQHIHIQTLSSNILEVLRVWEKEHGILLIGPGKILPGKDVGHFCL